jgi:hypothetical protein
MIIKFEMKRRNKRKTKKTKGKEEYLEIKILILI